MLNMNFKFKQERGWHLLYNVKCNMNAINYNLFCRTSTDCICPISVCKKMCTPFSDVFLSLSQASFSVDEGQTVDVCVELDSKSQCQLFNCIDLLSFWTWWSNWLDTIRQVINKKLSIWQKWNIVNDTVSVKQRFDFVLVNTTTTMSVSLDDLLSGSATASADYTGNAK